MTQQYDPRYGQQQWGQGGYAPPGYQQPQYPPPGYVPPGPPQPGPRKSRTGLFVGLGCGIPAALFILVVIIAALNPSSSSSTSAAVPAAPSSAAVGSAEPAKAPVTHSAAPAAAKPVTVATFSGSGEQKTPQFTVAANWAISYSFDCSSFGFKGNFVVLTDGGSDFNGVSVNDLAMSKAAVTYAYNDAGPHYLEINSECSWAIKVVSQG